MADPKLQVIIEAKDNASKEIDKFEGGLGKAKVAVMAIGAAMLAFGTAAAYGMKKAIDASNELNNALLGLNSVAKAFKQDTDKAKQAAIDLAKDGLMSVKEAASGLKNLLATGFSLPEAINLMNTFKDSAAFNRQGMLGFGQAIEGATQGIKNQNSIMVDNAGITKNLSIILKDAGFSQQDLSRVTQDASVRQALYNGLLKEGSIFQGDAARLSETLAGKQEALKTQIFMLTAAIGDQLKPTMTMIIETTSIFIGKISELVNKINLAGGIMPFFQNTFNQLMTFIDERTGIVTIFNKALDDIATVYNARLGPALQKLWIALQPLMPFISKLAEIFGVILYGALILIIKLIEVSLIVIIEMLTMAVEKINSGLEFFKKIWDGIVDTLAKAITLIDQLIEKMKSLNVVSAATNIIKGVLGFGGARAIGGPVASNKSYLVGENGPEMFTPTNSGNILPNNKIGGGVQLNITVNGDITGEDLIDRVGDALTKKLMLNSAIAG